MSVHVPHIQILPLPDDQLSIQIAGVERLRWNVARRYPRPFFYPIIGPSGRAVTRMGHPAAPDHDHHRSLWFGHVNVGGVNFWEERGGSQQIRQEEWVHYQDGDEEAAMAVRLGWFDAHQVRLCHQGLIASMRPLPSPASGGPGLGELWLELQMTFTAALEGLRFAKTNFGFMGLRMAKSISAHYGGGRLTNSNGAVGEKNVHEKPALWMDYSGPTVDAPGHKGPDYQNDALWEGITWFDHPSNLNHPTSWHTRDDGWMSAAFNLREAFELAKPLVLRYGLHVHTGSVNLPRAGELFKAFVASKAWALLPAERPWRYVLKRE